MESYGLNEALEDLAELESGNLVGDEQAQCITRVRALMQSLAAELEHIRSAGVVVDEPSS